MIEKIRQAMPTGVSEWYVAAQIAIGTLIGWLLCPALWLAVGPRAFMALVLARAAQESRYKPEAMGANAEYGVLQYSPLGATYVGWPIDADDDWRASPFWSGMAAARHTRSRLSSQARWWLLAVPVYRWAVFARSWRYGPDVTLQGAWTEAQAEGLYWEAWQGWTVLTAGPLLLLVALYKWGR